MNEHLGYSRDGDVVTLRMSADDYANLLLALGIAAGSRARDGPGWLALALALANRLNAGNPQWTPYEIPEETAR